jgi:capsular exopolysaccharide synthesis family protein
MTIKNGTIKMSLNDYFYLFKRYWLIISVVTSLTVATAAVWVETAKPVYQADCKLLIFDKNRSDIMLDQKDMVLGSLGKSDPITTQVEVMKTSPIYKEVIERCNLRNKEGKPLDPVELMADFTIQAVRLSNIVTVSYKSGNADSAAKIVNTFVNVTIEQNQNLNREEVRNMRIFVERQLESQKYRLEEIEQASVNFKKRENTVSIDLQTQSQINTAADIESAIMKIEGERQGMLAQQSQLELSLNVPRAQADPFYVSKLNMYEQGKNRLSSLEAQKASLTKQLREINNQLSTRPQEEVNLTRFLRDEKIAEKTYTDLLSTLEGLEIKEASRTASIKLIEPATSSQIPVSPKKMKLLLISLIAGLFMGFFIAYLIALLKCHPGSLSTIKGILPYGILGTVPVVQKKDLFFFREEPSSSQAELIRQIHTNLVFKGIYNSQHVNLLVTSAATSEGKRTVSLNLAYAIAETGKRTALVNFDLRRNAFGGFFKQSTDKGVADYLAGNAGFQEISSHYQEYGFDVIDAGMVSTMPAKVFLKGKISEFFIMLSSNYDVCIFYSAPVLTASETLDLSRYMTGIILVTDMVTSNTNAITAMNELIGNKGLPVLGTIVNRMNSRL